MSANPIALAANDPDAIETQEWLDALATVIEQEGPQRAHYLLERLVEHRRRVGAGTEERQDESGNGDTDHRGTSRETGAVRTVSPRRLHKPLLPNARPTSNPASR